MPFIGIVVGTVFGYWLKGTSISPTIDQLVTDVKNVFMNQVKKKSDK